MQKLYKATRKNKKIFNPHKSNYSKRKINHATPYKWLALATVAVSPKKKIFIHNGKKYYYTISFPYCMKGYFYKNKIIHIYGKKSLEHSLKKFYCSGYIYTFDKNRFSGKFRKKCKNMEVSFNDEIPLKIEYIEDPVKEMRKLGVTFEFVDITKE